MPKLKTLEQFVSQARNIHNKKYDYSKVIYNGSEIPIVVICNEHGEFFPTPSNHLRGTGCPQCNRWNSANKRRHDTQWFIENAKEKHGDKYIYDHVKYFTIDDKVVIYCRIHGRFVQKAYNHLRGDGCIHCRDDLAGKQRRKTTEQFISDAQTVHGNLYNYDKTIYQTSKHKVDIICLIHGLFEQIASNHLQGYGCPICNKASKGERFITEWLNGQDLTYFREHKFYGLKGKRFDFYLPALNLIIEFHGIQHFQPIKIFGGEEGYLRHKESDTTKERYLRDSSIMLLVLTDQDVFDIDDIMTIYIDSLYKD